MKAAYRISERSATAALSNVGIIRIPEPLMPYIEFFDVFTSTPKLQLCVCSCGDRMALCFSSAFASPDVPRRFFRMLTEMGISMTIITNLNAEEETA